MQREVATQQKREVRVPPPPGRRGLGRGAEGGEACSRQAGKVCRQCSWGVTANVGVLGMVREGHVAQEVSHPGRKGR